METAIVELDAFVSHKNSDAGERRDAASQVERHATFALTVSGHASEAVVAAIVVGQRGRPLRIARVVQDDLNLPSQQP